MAGRGGKRRGAGRKKEPKTLAYAAEKEALREETRRIIAPHLEAMILPQVAHAKGLQYLVTRDKKTGKFIRVGPAMAANSDEESIEVWEKDPSTQAFDSLLNRLLDKAKEQEQEIKVIGDVSLMEKIRRARARLAAKKKGEA